MKLAFTTLGCPEWSWDKVLSEAVRLGFQGIEIRGIENEMYLPDAEPFLPENIESTKNKLLELDLEICCLGSSAKFHDPETFTEFVNEAKAYIDLAEVLGVPFVRVFGDKIPDESKRNEIIKQVANGLQQVGEYAENTSVVVIIEAHGDFSRSDDLVAVLNLVESPKVGVLWDIHHPYRYFNENPSETFTKLKSKIVHTHFKDSIQLAEGFQYCLLGEGDMPIKKCISLLHQIGYQGWYSLEWEKKWHPEIEDPEEAFPYFVKMMKEYAMELNL